MNPVIPDNLLEGDVVYLPPDRVGAKARAAPGSLFDWPTELAIPVLAERMESIRRARRIDQNDLYCGMLRALLLHPNADSAASYRTILLEWQPQLEGLLRTAGVGWAAHGQPERGARYLRLATILEPDRPEPRHDLGVCLDQLAQQKDAEGDLGEAARVRIESERHIAAAKEMAPDLEDRTLTEIEEEMETATDALRRGAAATAREGFARVVQRQPLRWPAWLLLGVAHRMTGDFSKAVTALEKAVSLAPEQPVPRNELGLVRLFRREYGSAEEHLRAAVQLQPERAGYLCNLAIVLLQTDRLLEAEQILDRAAQLDPTDRIVARCREEARRFHNRWYRLLRRLLPLRDDGWKRPPSEQG